MKDTYMIKDFLKEYQDKQVSVDSILSKPVGGWTIFRIGNSEYKLSYMTDLPSIWLDTMIRDFGYSYVVSGDCEPEKMDCVVNGRNIHIFFSNRYIASYIIDKDFTKVIMNDIAENLEGWAEWSRYYSDDFKELLETKKELQSKLDKLNSLYSEEARRNKEFWRKIEENNLRIETEQAEQKQSEIIEIEPEEIIDLSADHRSV